MHLPNPLHFTYNLLEYVNKRGGTAVAHTERITYSLAGQAVAIRVSGDPDPANNGLFYLYNDHLGSAGAMRDENGQLVGGVTRCTPFGDYRDGSGPITDRAYTGQKENMADLGLYYYNARFYVPGLGRFLSADTLVPDPANPQSFNRYSYVLNSPINFNDPTSHCENYGDEYEDYDCWHKREAVCRSSVSNFLYNHRLEMAQI